MQLFEHVRVYEYGETAMCRVPRSSNATGEYFKMILVIKFKFRNWMNSMGVDPYVNWLYSDLMNGLVIFQVDTVVTVEEGVR